MTHHRRLTALLATLSSITAASAQPGRESVLNAVPDGAGLVVVAPSWKKLADGVQAFGSAIGSQRVAEVNLAQKVFEFEEGLDLSGTFVLAVMPGENPDPILVCPLKSAEAWKTAASASPAEGEQADLFRVIFHGDDSFAAIRNDVLLIAEHLERLKTASKGGGKWNARLRKSADLLEKNQLVILVDIPAWRETLEQGLTTFEMLMQQGMAMSGGAQAEAGVAFWKWGMSEFRRVLGEATEVTAAIRIGSEGVHLDKTVAFKPGGDMAKYLKDLKKTNRPLLRGLPDQPFLFAAGYEWESPPGTPTLSEKMMNMMMEGVAAEDKPKLEAAREKVSELYRQITGSDVAFSAAPDGNALVFSGAYFAKDSRGVMEKMAATMETSSAFMNTFAMGMKLNVTRIEEKLGDEPVHVYSFKFDVQDPQAALGIKLIYGDDPAMFVAARPELTLYAFGSREPARERMKLLLETREGLADNKRAASALKVLSPNPQSVAFVDLVRTAQFIMDALGRQGVPVPPVKLTEAPLPLTVMGIYLESEVIRAEIHVPPDPIRSLTSALRPGANAANQAE